MATKAPLFLIGSSLILQVTWTVKKSRMSSNFGQIRLRTAELAALARLENSPSTYNGRNVVDTLVSSFMTQSPSFLQVLRTCIIA